MINSLEDEDEEEDRLNDDDEELKRDEEDVGRRCRYRICALRS